METTPLIAASDQNWTITQQWLFLCCRRKSIERCEMRVVKGVMYGLCLIGGVAAVAATIAFYQRSDLPIPSWILGTAAVVTASFACLGGYCLWQLSPIAVAKNLHRRVQLLRQENVNLEQAVRNHTEKLEQIHKDTLEATKKWQEASGKVEHTAEKAEKIAVVIENSTKHMRDDLQEIKQLNSALKEVVVEKIPDDAASREARELLKQQKERRDNRSINS